MAAIPAEFPHAIIISTPFPTARLALSALKTLEVDTELSPLVYRVFSLSTDGKTLLTTYAATTNRMLRVSVNGFFESLRVVLQVVEELDVDVIASKGLEGLERVQGVEVGMEGTTVMGS